jgi:hypothetical protein
MARLHHGMRPWIEQYSDFVVNEGSATQWREFVEEDLQQLLEDVFEKLDCGLVELKCVADCLEICEEHVEALGHPYKNVKNMQQAVQALWIQRQEVSQTELQNMKPKRRATWLSIGSDLLRPYSWMTTISPEGVLGSFNREQRR